MSFLGSRWHRWYICCTKSHSVPRCQHEDAMLNDTRIRNAKPGERDYKLTDFDGL